VLTGGVSQMNGLKERLSSECHKLYPTLPPIQVPENPLKAPFRGVNAIHERGTLKVAQLGDFTFLDGKF